MKSLFERLHKKKILSNEKKKIFKVFVTGTGIIKSFSKDFIIQKLIRCLFVKRHAFRVGPTKRPLLELGQDSTF